MKKNIKTLAITGLVVGALAVGGIGTVAMASGNAYQSYKNAALSMTQGNNQTVITSFTAAENDVAILTGFSTMKIDGNNSYSSSMVDAGSESVDTEQSTVNGNMIHRVGSEYTSATLDRYDVRERPDAASSSAKLMNMVTDLLVGDVKTHFICSGDNITADLSGAQIPELLNVAISAMLEQGDRQQARYDSESSYMDILSSLPIATDASIQSVHINADLAGGEIIGQTVVIVLTGNDNSGTSHAVELTIQTKTTDIGSTTVQAIDTTGQTVNEANLYDYR